MQIPPHSPLSSRDALASCTPARRVRMLDSSSSSSLAATSREPSCRPYSYGCTARYGRRRRKAPLKPAPPSAPSPHPTLTPPRHTHMRVVRASTSA
eukprot:3812778-Prymnesium_polylepis.1